MKTRTPFDDLDATGDDVPESKRTQPLRPSGPPRRVGSVLGSLQNPGSTVRDDDDVPVPVNRPVINQPLPDDSDTNTAVLGRGKWLPMPTLIGIAAVVGALLVVLVPALMRRLIPTVPMRTMPTTISNAPTSNSVVLVPPDDATPLEETTGNTVPNSESAVSAPPVSDPSSEAEPPASVEVEPTPPTSDSTTETESSEEAVPPAREPQTAPSVNESDPGERYVNRREGYAIAPPAGFKLRSSGRRTTWRGPNNAQLLVETSNSTGPSPRADWEKLDKGLARKYGSRYQSFGIRDTTLNGRPAAVWEFQIGDIRKIDVAVHKGGRGYAVLGSAPASSFDELRPQLESAINSLELRPRATSSRRSNRSSRPAVSRGDDEDNDENGEAPARRDEEATVESQSYEGSASQRRSRAQRIEISEASQERSEKKPKKAKGIKNEDIYPTDSRESADVYPDAY
jgi:hypothetical protein